MDVENTPTHEGKLCFMYGYISASYFDIIYMRIHKTRLQNVYSIADNYLMNQTIFPLCVQAGERISFADDVVQNRLFKYGNTAFSIFVREILNDTAILDVHFGLEVYMTFEPRQSFIKLALGFVRGGLIHKTLKTQSSVKLTGKKDQSCGMGGSLWINELSENVLICFLNNSKSPHAKTNDLINSKPID